LGKTRVKGYGQRKSAGGGSNERRRELSFPVRSGSCHQELYRVGAETRREGKDRTFRGNGEGRLGYNYGNNNHCADVEERSPSVAGIRLESVRKKN